MLCLDKGYMSLSTYILTTYYYQMMSKDFADCIQPLLTFFANTFFQLSSKHSIANHGSITVSYTHLTLPTIYSV